MAKTEFWTGSEKYLCDTSLAHAFHIARTLGMPLLIEGEPGTGKTELALQYAADQDLPLFIYPTGSKSTIEQFVAKFDHVKYLRDSQMEILNAQRAEKGLDALSNKVNRSTENPGDYLIKGPGALSFSSPNSVLLIDEIDKAPREFPNDLLFALSHRKFVMPETGEIIESSETDMPAIVITSNREQELPSAFKGRCIYHYIDFPDPKLMQDIVHSHFPKIDTQVASTAIDIFYHLRSIGLERAPTTRELLNWLKFIKQSTTEEALEKIKALEGIGALVKTQPDLERVQRKILNNPVDYQRRSTPN